MLNGRSSAAPACAPATRSRRRARAALLAALALGVAGVCAAPGAPPAAAATTSAAASAEQPRTPPRATVVKVQLLFGVLGYPLGGEPSGRFGARTRGALSYFQRKYGLPVTGYPDARTVLAMESVASSLRGAAAAQAPPHDIVERTVGNGVPILPIAIALACLLALVALIAQRRSRAAQDLATAAEETSVSADGAGAGSSAP
jgi:hypothetical protein